MVTPSQDHLGSTTHLTAICDCRQSPDNLLDLVNVRLVRSHYNTLSLVIVQAQAARNGHSIEVMTVTDARILYP